MTKNLSNAERDIIKNILVADPSQRFEIAEIKAHSFFRGIDWKQIAKREINPPIPIDRLF
jgi:hypothetical protein